ncbi:SDR family oxidoreductase [Palleronia sediminis]|uniref:SDR family oxidoreductase n=1 Tax=Palleronia sediminis TaxID=2547833 RepID=A0A4R6AK36_9RHOB|nr:SDR family oxidoreductase [Palleronia sediminis]TDL81823.1 SDR family oxidoreductase [Palleronia sediminis]
MDLGLSGKTALVTGGASGIGKATAKRLAAEGAEVILVDVQGDAVSKAASQIGEGAHGLHCDLRDANQIDGLKRTVSERFQMPHILVCAAGVTGAKGHPLNDITDHDWHEAWQTDFMSVVRCMRAFVPGMAGRGWGRAIAITSENAEQPYWEEAVYNTAKAAVANFVKGLSRCYAQQGVLINSVSPAFIETPMTDRMMDRKAEQKGTSREEEVETFLETERPNLVVGRRGKPEEVAAAIAFLCSDHASFINGTNLRVDGGSVASMDA